MANNNVLFDAALAGAAGGINTRWLTNNDASSYIAVRNIIVAFANAVDSLILPDSSLTYQDANLLQEICYGALSGRYPLEGNNFNPLAQAVVALFTTLRSQNQAAPLPYAQLPNINGGETLGRATGAAAGPPGALSGAQLAANIQSLAVGALGSLSGGICIPFISQTVYAAGASPGTPDDVQITAGYTFAVAILLVIVLNSTGIVASTGQIRSASGGLGVALSQALSTGASNTTIYETTRGGQNVVGAGTPLFWRRSDQGVAGTVLFFARR